MSSSWNDDASQTTTASGSSVPGSDVSAVPTFPATTTGSPAARWMCPISSTVVVLPLEPVSAMNSWSSSRQPSSSSPITVMPRGQRRGDQRRLARHPGALDHASRCPPSRSAPSSPSRTSAPAATAPRARRRRPTAHPMPPPARPRAASARAAATPSGRARGPGTGRAEAADERSRPPLKRPRGELAAGPAGRRPQPRRGSARGRQRRRRGERRRAARAGGGDV